MSLTRNVFGFQKDSKQALTPANVSDRDGAISMIEAYACDEYILSKVLNFLVDGGYSGKNFAEIVKNITGAVVEVAKRNELHKFKVIPKRWVVERILLGLISTVGYGKTANENFTIRLK